MANIRKNDKYIAPLLGRRTNDVTLDEKFLI